MTVHPTIGLDFAIQQFLFDNALINSVNFFFFFVCSYSHATLLDHGGVLVNHFFPSAVLPRRAGSVAATRGLRPGLSLHLTPTFPPQGIKPTTASRGLNRYTRGTTAAINSV